VATASMLPASSGDLPLMECVVVRVLPVVASCTNLHR
jgi:hypothetical protein